MNADYLIIGGGVVGLSIACGLAEAGKDVLVLDGEDGDFRASRGNFGLVWVQGKGLSQPEYARWTLEAARRWGHLSERLAGLTGIDIAYAQTGGYDIELSPERLAHKAAQYSVLRDNIGEVYRFEVMDAITLRSEEPAVSGQVAGALYCPMDGQVNPLLLLRALSAALTALGGRLQSGVKVSKITHSDTGVFTVSTEDARTWSATQVILCAGLGATELGSQLGFSAKVSPQRGQVLVTEKLKPLLRRPSLRIRQVNEGGVQIGDSKEDVGLDDRETLPTTASIARNAIRVIPALAEARLVRSWAALRVMSADGLPIYQRSASYPGAFLVTCHSGITLAANHYQLLPKWLLGTSDAPKLEAFNENRFAVPACADHH